MKCFPFISQRIQTVLCLSTVLLAFTACGGNDDEFVDPDDAQQSVTIRLNNEAGGIATLSGTMVGTYILGDNGATALAVKTDNNGNIVLPSSTQDRDVLVYCPWQSTWTDGIVPTEALFNVESDQSMAAGYQASDLMMGHRSAGASTVVMRHLLARVVVHVVDETGTMDFSHGATTLRQVHGSVTIDVARQQLVTTDSRTDVQMYSYAITDRRMSTEAVVAPQTIAAGTSLVAIRLYGTLHTCAVNEQSELTAGSTLTISYRLTESGLIMDGSTLSDWEDDGGRTLVI